LEPAGSGARVVGPERGQRVKASDLGLDLRGLEPRLGPFVPQLREEQSWQRRVGLAQASLRSATSWSGLHREFEALGFAVEKTGRGGRVLDVETARHVPLGHVATSMVRLEERLGAYELSPAVAARDAREEERRAVGITERVERLRETPELVLERLAETRSVWSEADVERAGCHGRDDGTAVGHRRDRDVQVRLFEKALVLCVEDFRAVVDRNRSDPQRR